MQLTIPETITIGLAQELVFRRGKRADTAACRRTLYYSGCGMYRLEKSEATGLPVRWRACVRVGGDGGAQEPARWEIVSVHRKRETAEAACRDHAARRRRLQSANCKVQISN